MTHEIHMDHAVQALVADAPKLRPVHDDLVRDYVDPGPYVVFGGFARYVESLLRHGDVEAAAEVFRSMEQLAANGDLATRELVQMGFLENVGDDPGILQEARRLMGPATQQLSREIERHLGRESASD